MTLLLSILARRARIARLRPTGLQPSSRMTVPCPRPRSQSALASQFRCLATTARTAERNSGQPELPKVPFFEGREKLLELWFDEPARLSAAGQGLRTIPRAAWDRLLGLADCTIIEEQRTPLMDAYILSESSLFVMPEHIVIKTCGSTAPLLALPDLLEEAWALSRQDLVEVYYSRHDYLQPNLQAFPHEDFGQEVTFLESHVGPGVARQFGRPDEHQWNLFAAKRGSSVHASQTIEVIMYDADPTAMAIFYEVSSSTKEAVTLDSGIADLLPTFDIREALFSPCGYSCNGVHAGAYMTVHVTPQPECSYISFESNVLMRDYTDLVTACTRAFRPKHVQVAIVSN
ncbi:uncharacterized protein MONBRDRAFT_20810, partial [Monosiga brevicollis MX1]